MPVPFEVIANADDLGLHPAVDEGILQCYQMGYINSTSLLTNMPHFAQTAQLIHSNPCINTIGLHINLTEGAPVTSFKASRFLTHEGKWNTAVVGHKATWLNTAEKAAFYHEMRAQVDKALTSGIAITHVDSHHHIHTFPHFLPLFLQIARQYKLPLRLAQTYREGSILPFLYRQGVNWYIKKQRLHFSDYFEDVRHFLKNGTKKSAVTEVMLHPALDEQGKLTDHYDPSGMRDWIALLERTSLL